MLVPSACNEANKGDIAKAVLMPGDPLRAKYVAENYFENPVCFNGVRNMGGFFHIVSSSFSRCFKKPSFVSQVRTAENIRTKPITSFKLMPE